MEQQTKNMKESSSEDEIKFLTALKPGVTDLRPYLPTLPEVAHIDPWSSIMNGGGLVTSISAEFLTCPKEIKSLQRCVSLEEETRYFHVMIHRRKHDSTTLFVVYLNICQILCSHEIILCIEQKFGPMSRNFKPNFHKWIVIDYHLFSEIVKSIMCIDCYGVSKFISIHNNCPLSIKQSFPCLIEAPGLCKLDHCDDISSGIYIRKEKLAYKNDAAYFSIDALKFLGCFNDIGKKHGKTPLLSNELNTCHFPDQLVMPRNPILFGTNRLESISIQSNVYSTCSSKSNETHLMNKYLLSIHNTFKSIHEILSSQSLITKQAKFQYTDLFYDISKEFYETLNTHEYDSTSYMYSINLNICIAKLNLLLTLLIQKFLLPNNNRNKNIPKLTNNYHKNTQFLSYNNTLQNNYLPRNGNNFKLKNYSIDKEKILSSYFCQNYNTKKYAIPKMNLIKKESSDDSVYNVVQHCNVNHIKGNLICSHAFKLNADLHTEVRCQQIGITEETQPNINLNRRKQNTNLSHTNNDFSFQKSVPSLCEIYETEPVFEIVNELSCNIHSTLHLNISNIYEDLSKSRMCAYSEQLNTIRNNDFNLSRENVNIKSTHCRVVEKIASNSYKTQVTCFGLVQNRPIKETVQDFIHLQFKPRILRKSYSSSKKQQSKLEKRFHNCVQKQDRNAYQRIKGITSEKNDCSNCTKSEKCVDTSYKEEIGKCIISVNETLDIDECVGTDVNDMMRHLNDIQCLKSKELLRNTYEECEQTEGVDLHLRDAYVLRKSEAKLCHSRNVIPSDAPALPHDTWLHGGTLGNKNAVLVFRSSALANSSEASVQSRPGHKLHITYRVVQAETKLLSKLLECHGVTEAPQNTNDFNLLWTGSHPKPGVLRSMAPHQRVNHFPRSYELTRKDRLYKNIEKMQHAKGLKHFDFIPQTFLMPTEYKELCSTHHRVKGPWIVKPAASSRGRGIYIVESPNQVPLEEPVVVAKYISKPLLVRGHKCDLRLYVAVTSFDPLLVYIYEEGMVRFATVKYDTTHKQLWNPCMHLCNYSINKYHSDYVKSDDPSAENVGHKWTLSALLRHLKSLGKDTGHLMSQVEDLVVKAILACGNSIITACKMFVPNANNCFELYGFDILIDENLKPWLLEVNLSPSLGCDSPLDVRLKSAMLSDLLTLVGIPAIDPILRPTASPTNSSKNLKMKLSNCRRVHSADGLSNTLPKKSGTNTALTTITLTAEDVKMVKNAKTQFERRGGFVRIFPAVDSWAKYSQYLEPLTGIPIAGSSSSLPFTMMTQHNFNQILYIQLFPDVPLSTPILRNDKLYVRHSLDRRRDASLDSVRKHDVNISTPRQDRYERKLVQGHRSSLTVPKKQLKESHSAELKRQISDMIKSGKRMSQVEARRAFSQYLTCVLKRISSSPDQEGHVEIVLKFLQKASTYLKSPFNVKIPSQKLSEKDRAAVVAKQLNDFLYLYNRETDFYGEMNSQIPKQIFSDFLEHARESDLEEVLILQNIHTVPNKGNQSTSSFQGLLRCLPNLTGSTCFRTPDTNKKGVKVTPLS